MNHDEWHREVERESSRWGREDTQVSAFFGVLIIAIMCVAAVLHAFS